MPASTPAGFPYALGSDARLDWPALSQQLATKLQDTPGGPIFASAAARDAAIPVPVKGMRCWRSDLNHGEVFGTAWRRDSGVAGSAHGTTRFGFGLWQGTITTDASGYSQVLDLSNGGTFTGNVLWCSLARSGITTPYQAAIVTGGVAVCKVAVSSGNGTILANTTLALIGLAYMAALTF